MSKRVATGIVLGAMILLSVFIHPIAWSLLICAAIGIAIWELAVAFHHVEMNVPLLPVMLGAFMMILSVNFGGLSLMMITYIVACTAILLYASFENTVMKKHSSYTSGIFILTYIPLMFSFYAAFLYEEKGALKLILVIICVVASDTGGLLTGMRFGKHKMCEAISPKKTWEGLAGSYIFAIVAALAYCYFVMPTIYYLNQYWWPLCLSLIVVTLATFGDLAESVIKRDAQMKDIGGILPGHGGMLDRLDSFALVAPFAYYFILYTL